MPHRHRIALLMLLEQHAPAGMRRDKLLAFLWPEQDTASGRNLLNVAVHGVRKELGAAALRSTGDELTLDHALIGADVRDFLQAVRTADVDQALALYRGPFADGFHLAHSAEFDHWMTAVRTELSGALAGLLDRAADGAAQGGDHARAAKLLQRRLADDPYNTKVAVQLVLALERTKQRAAALQVARAHSALLRSELDLAPDPALLALTERLLRAPSGDLALPPAPPAERPAAASPWEQIRGSRWKPLLVGLPLLVLAAGLWRTGRRTPPHVTPLIVAPVGGDARWSHLRHVVRDAMVLGVREHLPGVELSLLPGQQHSGRALSLVSSLGTRGDSITATLQLRRAGTDVIDRVAMVGLLARDSAELAGQFASQAVGLVAIATDPRLRDLSGPEHRSPPIEVLQRFLHGMDAFARSEYVIAAQHFADAATQDPGFLLARVWEMMATYYGARYQRAASIAAELSAMPLAEVDRFGVAWLVARLRGDVPAAFRAAREAATRAPRSQWAIVQADEALTLRRPNEALSILRALDPEPAWVGGWSGYSRVRARALHLQGDFESEEAVAAGAQTAGTDLFARAISSVPALAAQGRTADLDRLIDQALAIPDQPTMSPGSLMQNAGIELEAHGWSGPAQHFYQRAVDFYASEARRDTAAAVGRWALGRMLFRVGEADSAQRVLLRLHRQSPSYAVAADLGWIAASRGDRAAAMGYDSILATPGSGREPFAQAIRLHHRGVIAAALGDRVRALDFLRQAIALGVPLPMDSVHIHPAFRALRGWGSFDNVTRVSERF